MPVAAPVPVAVLVLSGAVLWLHNPISADHFRYFTIFGDSWSELFSK
jgi:hypothetical protein